MREGRGTERREGEGEKRGVERREGHREERGGREERDREKREGGREERERERSRGREERGGTEGRRGREVGRWKETGKCESRQLRMEGWRCRAVGRERGEQGDKRGWEEGRGEKGVWLGREVPTHLSSAV